MSEPLYVTRSSVEKVRGLERRARLFDGTELTFGVHGPIQEYFKLQGHPELPLPVDYIVAATGG